MTPFIPKTNLSRIVKTEPVNTPEMMVALRKHHAANERVKKALFDMSEADGECEEAQRRFDVACIDVDAAWEECEAANDARELAGIPASRVVEDE